MIEPFDSLSSRRECLLGRLECSDGNPCAAHDRWKRVHDQVSRFFRETTVAELVRSPATLAATLHEKGEAHE